MFLSEAPARTSMSRRRLRRSSCRFVAGAAPGARRSPAASKWPARGSCALTKSSHGITRRAPARIDSRTFLLVRTDATQAALRGPISSSREVDDYEINDEAGVAMSLLRGSDIFQVYVGPAESTPIHRVIRFERHEVNAPDFAARL